MMDNIFSGINKEVSSFSITFKTVFCIGAIIYISLWFFTIHLSSLQIEQKIEPILPALSKDSIEYVRLSESLLSGHGLRMDGRVETLRLPGYPLFVGSIKTATGSYFGVTFVQIILVFLSGLIIRRIGIFFSGRKVGEISAVLFLINPVTMTLALLVLTDVLFLFLFILGVYLALSLSGQRLVSKTVIIALLFIGAVYVRGMGIFALPIFIAPFFGNPLPFRIQIKLAGLAVLLVLVSSLPWVLRNYRETGVPAFNSFESVNLSWSVPKFLAVINHSDEEVETLAFQKETGVPASEWQNLGWHDIRYSKQINSVGEKIILSHPFSYLKFHLITSVPFLFPSSIQFAREAYDSALNIQEPFVYGAINSLTTGDWKNFLIAVTKDWWKMLERVLWLLGLILAGFTVWRERKNTLVWILVFIPFYLMLLSGPASGPRLSFQAWPFMFILFAFGAVSLLQKFSGTNS